MLLYLIDIIVIIYLNNILIYSNNPTNYDYYIKEVLIVLRKYGLFTKLEKYEFSINIIEFLGFIISPKGIIIDLILVNLRPTYSSR